MPQWTEQQSAVFDHFRSSRKDLLVEAVAGAGKSTTVLEAVIRSTDPSTLIAAFNKHIQQDMEFKLEAAFNEGRLPANRLIIVRTLHSLGLEILRREWRNITIKNSAGDAIAREAIRASGRVRYQVVRLVRYCKDVHPRLLELPEPALFAAGVARRQIRDLKILESLELLMEIGQGVVDVMQASLYQRKEVDYADMIWLPLVHRWMPKGRFSRVVVDEAQDMSLGQFELLERYPAAQGGSIVAVGDLRQGVSEFRGADGAAIWKRMEERGAVNLPLTTSFRCSRAVVEEAQRLVPVIDCLPTAPEGLVADIPISEVIDKAQPGDFILSRTNADLITLAIDVWLKGREVVIEGGNELLDPLLQILDKLSFISAQAYTNSLNQWFAEQSRNADKEDSSWTDLVEDWYNLLTGVAERVGHNRVESALRDIFRGTTSESFTSPSALTFATVHKVKGREAKRVFLIQQSFKQHRGIPADKITAEEWNIEYVGVTRAQEELYWAQDAEAEQPSQP